MRQESEISPRKTPRQARARATVEAIIEATARVLLKDGYDALSTNRVAEEAGVSIGSLYQYFPSKQALIIAVAQKHCEQMLARFEAAVTSLGDAPIPEVTRQLIRLFIDAHAVDPKLHRVIMEQIPLVGRRSVVAEYEKSIATVVRGFLEARARELRPTDLDMATFVLVHAIEALTHAAVLERPEYLKGNRLVDEAVELVVRYLDPGTGFKAKARA